MKPESGSGFDKFREIIRKNPVHPALFFVILIFMFFGRGPGTLWDFRFYASGTEHGQYTYSLIGQLFLVPFERLPYPAAEVIWQVLIAWLLFLIVRVWYRIIKDENPLVFLLFVFLSFKCVVPYAAISGNTEIIMQLFIWKGLYAFIRNRDNEFLAWLFFAASFKYFPIIFAALLVLNDPRNIKKVLLYWFIFALYGLGSFLFLWKTGHYESLVKLGSQGHYFYPYIVRLVRAPFKMLGHEAIIDNHTIPVYLALAAAIAAFSFKAVLRARKSRELLTMTAMAVLMALWPRGEFYSFMLAVPPAYYIIKKQPSFWFIPFYVLFIFNLPQNEEYNSYLCNGILRHIVTGLLLIMWFLYLKQSKKAGAAGSAALKK